MSNCDPKPLMLQLCWISTPLCAIHLCSTAFPSCNPAQEVAKENDFQQWASLTEEKGMTQALFHGIISQSLCLLWNMCVCKLWGQKGRFWVCSYLSDNLLK